VVGIDSEYQHAYSRTKAMEDEVKLQQVEINRLRGEIEIKKYSLETYESLLREKETQRLNKIQLISKKNHRCQECGIGFSSPLFFNQHMVRFHGLEQTQVEEMLKEEKAAMEFAYQEEKETIKEIIQENSLKISTLIAEETQ
jgi:hypothetical protein